ncbi:MAG: GNAT family N-acetyltransferase [Bacteroidia bacterium]|nr:GNAT family N-acetyltransferase [Bacteroidia bacterium]
MNFLLKSFNDLSNLQIFQLYQLRAMVFVVEQNCPYQDVDDKDLEALHLMLYENDSLAAYCRILPPGLSYDEPSIGRVVVRKEFRRKKMGDQLMKQSIKLCLDLFKNQDIVISAQSYLKRFYNDLGFLEEGETYLEDDIPHIKMRYLKH